MQPPLHAILGMSQDIETQEEHLHPSIRRIANLQPTKHLGHPTLPYDKMRNTTASTHHRPILENGIRNQCKNHTPWELIFLRDKTAVGFPSPETSMRRPKKKPKKIHEKNQEGERPTQNTDAKTEPKKGQKRSRNKDLATPLSATLYTMFSLYRL